MNFSTFLNRHLSLVGFQIVFIDEATSSVDVETAAVMDRLMAEEFKSSTVFIVAHRLRSLSYCDHLLIMEDGRVNIQLF